MSSAATSSKSSAASPLRLLLGGDVMLGRQVARILREEGPHFPFAALSALTESVDLFFVNLECALSDRRERFAGEPKAFYFRAGTDAVLALVSARVSLVSLANNHSLDAGVAGLADTQAILARHRIACVGAGPDLAAASAMRVLERNGVRVGVLAACDHQFDFAAAENRPGIHVLDLSEPGQRRHLVELVRREAARVDHLVVSLHWLPNWVSSLPAGYRVLAGDIIAAGARVVWGHSPHHILGSEVWPQGVVLYSTGDLIDDYAIDQNYRNDRQLLYLLELGADGVTRLGAFPISLQPGRAEPADATARRWIEGRLRATCEPLHSEVVAGRRGLFEIRRRASADAHGAVGSR